jgi:hypothetical protein
MESLPTELYLRVIDRDIEVYRGMLAIPKFARGVDVTARIRWMKWFTGESAGGYSTVAGKLHGWTEPAAMLADNTPVWCAYGKLHCDSGPAVIIGGKPLLYHHGILYDHTGAITKGRRYKVVLRPDTVDSPAPAVDSPDPAVDSPDPAVDSPDPAGHCTLEMYCGCVAENLPLDYTVKFITRMDLYDGPDKHYLLNRGLVKTCVGKRLHVAAKYVLTLGYG